MKRAKKLENLIKKKQLYEIELLDLKQGKI